MDIALSPKNATVIAAATAHGAFTNSVTAAFHWFQEAVKGIKAEADFDAGIAAIQTQHLAEATLPARLDNAWNSYVGSLRSAYLNFGRDVVTRLGVDETSQVRNLALSIASSSFQEARRHAREQLVSQVEAQVVAQ